MNTRGSPLPARYDTSPLRRPRFSLSNLSIKQRLPLLIGTLLVGIITVSIWTTYRGVKESALEVGRERLSSLTQQLANQSQQSLPIVLNRTFTAANDPAVRTFLKTSSAGSRTAATSVLQQFAPAQDPSSLQVELWNVAGSLALSVPEGSAPEPADLGTEFSQSGVDPFKVVGSIRIVNDVVVYTVTAAVKDDQGKPIGYLVRWRRAAPTPNLRKQLSDLLGSEATLYYGNSKGDVWTDLEKAVPKPPVSLASTLEVTRYMRDGNAVMAMGRPIAGTPWFMLLEFPERAFLAQPKKFLRLSLIIGVLLLMAGVAGAFALTRSITVPLRSFIEAAYAISGGDYSRRVAVRGCDELGELANAFNLMLVKASETQRELEHELTERTSLNETLEERVANRTAQLQAANKELEAFSYSVSHDLRAPLRHIDGFSQALLEDYPDQLDDAGKSYLREVRSASQEMAQLIDDMLQLARVTRSEMRREVVNLSELARASAADLKQREPKRKVTFNIKEELATHGDKRLLRIALNNLLGNALKFTAKRAQAQITFGQEKKNGQTTYFVRDNGAGFDMAYVSKLFGAFQRLHTAGEFEGTGIGLATVQRIVYRHGGRVWAEGAVDEGATFYFTLPGSKETGDEQQSDSTG